jgi:isoquinoline 1-oxidoreductase alpha subunit
VSPETVEFTLNRQAMRLEIEPDTPLLWVLRDELNLNGTKFGCGKGLCGACTVHLDGSPMRSCALPVGAVAGRTITTIEGLSLSGAGRGGEAGEAPDEALVGKPGDHPLQRAWMAENVPQCGYCQSGQIMSAAALLAKNPNPTDEDIDAAMSGNICRCGTYQRIRKAIKRAAVEMQGAVATWEPAASNTASPAGEGVS